MIFLPFYQNPIKIQSILKNELIFYELIVVLVILE